MNMGNTIKELRTKKLMSQEKIAEELGVSRQSVSKWENGLSNPDTANLIALAQLLEVSVDELTDNESNVITGNEREEGNSESRAEEAEKKNVKRFLRFFLLMAGGIILLLLIGNIAIKVINRKEPGHNPSVILTDKATVNPEEATDTDNNVDYLNSPDSVALQKTAQAFAKAYFSRDEEEIKLYIADAESAETYESDIYDNLQYLTLKWNPEDLAAEAFIKLQYQFQTDGEDSASYLGLEMMKISEKWKVVTWYLEK